MSSKPYLIAIVGLLLQRPAVFPRPPEGPSGRMVQDQVPALAAEVKRLEKEVAKGVDLADDLAAARARLLAAQGRTAAARAAWQEIISGREHAVARWEALVARKDLHP